MLFACSDIHGNFEVYMKVINKLSENDKLYIIGDVIDRGADGIKILLDIMKRDNVEFILGNHEWMLLVSVMSNWNKVLVDTWTHEKNQGLVTMKNLLELDDEVASSLVDFLADSVIAKRIVENGKTINIIHGFYDNRVEKILNMSVADVINEVDMGDIWEGSTNFDILWKSPLKKDPINAYKSNEYYIHGHVPVIRANKDLEPFKYQNIIFIDGGLQYGGGLILYNITNESFEIIN